MGLRLVDVFRSALRDLVAGRGSVIVDPLDLAWVPAMPEQDDVPPPAWRAELGTPGLAPV